ncbi:17802_t:CDS:2, partial [Gigaspora margarita]
TRKLFRDDDRCDAGIDSRDVMTLEIILILETMQILETIPILETMPILEMMILLEISEDSLLCPVIAIE